MSVSVLLDAGLKIVSTLASIGGIGAFFSIRAQKSKIVADSGKTNAEADSITADAQEKRGDRELKLTDRYERWADLLQERLDEAENKIALLTEYVEVLVQALRSAGSPVPSMPRKMAEDARARIDDPQTGPHRAVRPPGRDT